MHQPVLLTVAAEHPILDIDLTIVLQLGIFLATAFIATKYLFRPYLTMRTERVEGIDGARKDADDLKAQAAAQLADYEDKLASARARAFDEQRKIRADATTHQNEVTAKARAEVAQTLTEARKSVAEKTDAARSELLPKADALAAGIVSKLIGREVA